MVDFEDLEKSSPNDPDNSGDGETIAGVLGAAIPGDAPGIKSVDGGDAIETKSVEAAGIITDGVHTWQVPADNVDDLDDLYAGDVYKIPKKISDTFHVQLIPQTRLKEYTARGYVPVTLKELEVPEELRLSSGTPLDSYHVVDDAIMVKIPQVIHDRIKAREVREVKQRLKTMEPTQQMLEDAARSGIHTRFEHTTGADLVNPKDRMALIRAAKDK